MDDVETHEQGNAKAGFLHRETLDGASLVRAPEVEQVSNPPGSNPLVQVVKLARTGDHAGRSDHIELPDLFIERHGGEQRIDASHALALSSTTSRWFRLGIFSLQETDFASGVCR